MSTEQPPASPPVKPAWWGTDVTVEEVAAELADYLDLVDEYVTRTCTPEYLERKRREICAAVRRRAEPPKTPDTC